MIVAPATIVPWKCCGCGAVSQDRERVCDCSTNVLFRRPEGGTLVHEIKTDAADGRQMISIEQLRELTALQAEDDALWAPATYIETGYAQQALRFLTLAIEGEWTFETARDAIKDMMP